MIYIREGVVRLVERDLRRIDRTVKRDLGKLLQQEIREEKRVPIPSKTKRAVYERAGRRCESCGYPLKMTDKGAQFHHLRKPTAKSRPSTIQFLCATCHRKHGHKFYTVTKQDLLGTIRERRIKRKKVRKHQSPYWKEKPKSAKKKPKTKRTQKITKTRKKRHTTRKRPKTPSEKILEKARKDFLGS